MGSQRARARFYTFVGHFAVEREIDWADGDGQQSFDPKQILFVQLRTETKGEGEGETDAVRGEQSQTRKDPTAIAETLKHQRKRQSARHRRHCLERTEQWCGEGKGEGLKAESSRQWQCEE